MAYSEEILYWQRRLLSLRLPGCAFEQPEKSTNPLAKGGFGDVYKYSFDNTDLAVKRLKKQTTSRLQFLSEVMILSLLKHTNVVRLFGFIDEKSYASTIILEWVEGSDLNKFIHERKGLYYITSERIINIALQVARGLEYLHSMGILHCDFKTANIMYDSFRNSVKIVDMGFAISTSRQLVLNTEYMRLRQPNSIKYWYAPEQLHTDGKSMYRNDTDVFAFGIVIFELVVGDYPYRSNDIKEKGIIYLLNNIRSKLINTRMQINPNLPREMVSLILDTARINREERIDMNTAVKWLEKIETQHKSRQNGIDNFDLLIYQDFMSETQRRFEVPLDSNNTYLAENTRYFNLSYFRNNKPNMYADANPQRVGNLSNFKAPTFAARCDVPFRRTTALYNNNVLHKSAIDLTEHSSARLKTTWVRNMLRNRELSRSLGTQQSDKTIDRRETCYHRILSFFKCCPKKAS